MKGNEMTLEEIKAAVLAGKTVHWSNTLYRVIPTKYVNDNGEPDFMVICDANQHCIGLTWRDGVTMNGEPDQFFIGDK